MEQVVDLGNMRSAYRRVVENKGVAGVDDVPATELRGWLKENWPSVKEGVLDELDQCVRRRLRCLLWRQWEKPRTRARKPRALGLEAQRARSSAGNGHGPWWNAGASHMHQALPARSFTHVGLVSPLPEQRRLQRGC